MENLHKIYKKCFFPKGEIKSLKNTIYTYFFSTPGNLYKAICFCYTSTPILNKIGKVDVLQTHTLFFEYEIYGLPASFLVEYFRKSINFFYPKYRVKEIRYETVLVTEKNFGHLKNSTQYRKEGRELVIIQRVWVSIQSKDGTIPTLNPYEFCCFPLVFDEGFFIQPLVVSGFTELNESAAKHVHENIFEKGNFFYNYNSEGDWSKPVNIERTFNQEDCCIIEETSKLWKKVVKHHKLHVFIDENDDFEGGIDYPAEDSLDTIDYLNKLFPYEAYIFRGIDPKGKY